MGGTIGGDNNCFLSLNLTGKVSLGADSIGSGMQNDQQSLPTPFLTDQRQKCERLCHYDVQGSTGVARGRSWERPSAGRPSRKKRLSPTPNGDVRLDMNGLTSSRAQGCRSDPAEYSSDQ